MRARSRRATIRDVLDTALDLERKTMQLYAALVRTFKAEEPLRSFWFSMARHEAGHCGALGLVESLLESDPSLAGNQKVWLADSTVARLRALLTAYLREVRCGVDIHRALEMTLDIESSELEDVVVDLLQVVTDRRWRDQATQMLLHDLGDLSFMIEKYTSDRVLLARADELVERRVSGLRSAGTSGRGTAARTRGGSPRKGSAGRPR